MSAQFFERSNNMSAVGKVCTGFSLPYVAKYAASGGTVTYSDGQKLARGVSVSVAPDSSDNNDFYADNVKAESVSGVFTGGTITLTVDGLLPDAEKLIFGLPTASTVSSVSVYEYGDDAVPPYMGIGFIARYMSDGVTTYKVIVLTKCKFNLPTDEAATQEDQIAWQTQSLEASIMRDDTADHNWKYVGVTEYTTEALAEADLKKLLSIT